MIGRSVDQYLIVSKLGQGGMGEVYVAEDTTLGRRVAVKFLSPGITANADALERFRREARAAAALEHPGIAAVHHVGTFEGRPYLVMTLVEGRTLEAILADGPIPAQDTQAIARQLAEALAAAHNAGVVHRDIKPANIVVDDNGRTRILDFGIAKLEGLTAITGENTTLGTVQYMSPEQVRGEEVDARSDLFSLGAVIYEMLAGRPPFGGGHPGAVVHAILNEAPDPPPPPGGGAAPDLRPLTMALLQKKRENRIPTAAAVAEQLSDPGARPAAPAPRGSRWTWPVIGAVVAVLIYLMSRSGGDGRDEPGGDAAARRLIGTLTTTQLTFQAGIEEWPSWSPDGERMAYAAEVDGFRKIHVRSLESGNDRALTTGSQDDIQPAWSPDGRRIAFVRANLPTGRLSPSDVLGMYYEGGDIFVLDVESGVAEKTIDDAFNPSFAPDGSQIAFDAELAGARRIWAADPRGRNPVQLTTDESEAVDHVTPRWSPDGNHIIYRRIEKTRADIEMLDVNTRASVRLTSDAFNDLDPAWSPDGRYVYFSSYRGGGLNIWRVNVAEGGGAVPEQVTTGAGDDVQTSVSPDGNRLAFVVLGLNSDLWTLPLDPSTGAAAGEPRALVSTTREDSRGAWSPDGETVAFNSDRAGDMNIWLHDMESGTDRQLTRGAGGDYQANWSPDGGRVAFFSSRAGNADIWVVDVVEGATPKQLTDDPGLDINPFFAPDGRHIAFQSDRGGRSELWTMTADGSDEHRVADVEASGHFMRWFDDGRRIIFASGDGADRIIYAVDVESGALQTMPRISSGAHMSFSPDHSHILETAGHRVLWVYLLADGSRTRVLEFGDPDIRVDYPVWSPDGAAAVFDRVVPRGGDIWILDGLR